MAFLPAPTSVASTGSKEMAEITYRPSSSAGVNGAQFREIVAAMTDGDSLHCHDGYYQLGTQAFYAPAGKIRGDGPNTVFMSQVCNHTNPNGESINAFECQDGTVLEDFTLQHDYPVEYEGEAVGFSGAPRPDGLNTNGATAILNRLNIVGRQYGVWQAGTDQTIILNDCDVTGWYALAFQESSGDAKSLIQFNGGRLHLDISRMICAGRPGIPLEVFKCATGTIRAINTVVDTVAGVDYQGQPTFGGNALCQHMCLAYLFDKHNYPFDPSKGPRGIELFNVVSRLAFNDCPNSFDINSTDPRLVRVYGGSGSSFLDGAFTRATGANLLIQPAATQ